MGFDLLPRELDKLHTLHVAGSLAQKRLARGVRLNEAEATALIANVLHELIRDGNHSVAELMAIGTCPLSVPSRVPVQGLLSVLDSRTSRCHPMVHEETDPAAEMHHAARGNVPIASPCLSHGRNPPDKLFRFVRGHLLLRGDDAHSSCQDWWKLPVLTPCSPTPPGRAGKKILGRVHVQPVSHTYRVLRAVRAGDRKKQKNNFR
jgi:urease gamma subunit